MLKLNSSGKTGLRASLARKKKKNNNEKLEFPVKIINARGRNTFLDYYYYFFSYCKLNIKIKLAISEFSLPGNTIQVHSVKINIIYL